MDVRKTPSLGRVAIFRSPGMGHLIPCVEFAKLLFRRGFSVTLISFTVSSTQSEAEISVLEALPKAINAATLPPPSMNDMAQTSKIGTRLWVAAARSRISLSDLLKDLPPQERLVALVVDLFGIQASEVAQEFDVPCYLFFTTSLLNLRFVLDFPKLDETISGEFRDAKEPIKLPGCLPVRGIDLCDTVQERSDEVYSWYLQFCWRCRNVKSIFVNSFAELEPDVIRALKEDPDLPEIYPVGPLVRSLEDEEMEQWECLRWLDKQPNDSVLFVSFGSGGTLSSAQLQELAMGLEMSEQRFLWVVRSSNEESNSAAFLTVGGGASKAEATFSYLPDGFVSRNLSKGLGFVVASWGPQVRVLSHSATGGFMSHCGWNSTLESLMNGVPIIAWPLYAEQYMNVVMLVEGLRVAIRADAAGEREKGGVVGREAIACAVRALMEGEEGMTMRSRMQGLRAAAKRALGEKGSCREVLLSQISSRTS
ncbi:hydroquinone glucosyltransferase-like [Aristolochia californica]|uniref:hydroquinone glucosyltransferase-like n=1 Tax=Aristolochia californica TaxID=171875 RepID=UPI0035DF3641